MVKHLVYTLTEDEVEQLKAIVEMLSYAEHDMSLLNLHLNDAQTNPNSMYSSKSIIEETKAMTNVWPKLFDKAHNTLKDILNGWYVKRHDDICFKPMEFEE